MPGGERYNGVTDAAQGDVTVAALYFDNNDYLEGAECLLERKL